MNTVASSPPRRIAVVGAGQIGQRLVRRLAQGGHATTWLSRTTPQNIPEGVDFKAVDAQNGEALAEALGGSEVMIAAINPSTYDARVWADLLPPMHRGLISAALQKDVRVVLLEGLYHYALDAGPISPDTPHRPATEKGRIRQSLVSMWRSSGARLTTFCASDFWGAGLSKALVTTEGLSALKRGKPIFVVGNPEVEHAFTHVDDIIEGLCHLALSDDTEGLTFHAPVTHMTQRAVVAMAANAIGAEARTYRAPRWLLRVAGLFDRDTGGIVEMLPQWTQPYRVDDSAYRRRFRAVATARW